MSHNMLVISSDFLASRGQGANTWEETSGDVKDTYCATSLCFLFLLSLVHVCSIQWLHSS